MLEIVFGLIAFLIPGFITYCLRETKYLKWVIPIIMLCLSIYSIYKIFIADTSSVVGGLESLPLIFIVPYFILQFIITTSYALSKDKNKKENEEEKIETLD